MSLQLKITELGTNSDGKKLYLENGTGNYDAVNNEGGFGAPNPERLDLALILVANFKNVNSDVPAEIAAYNPLTATSFTLTISQDGWLQASLFAVDLYDNEAVYEEGDFVYNTDESQLKQYVDGVFQNIEEEALLESDVTVIQYNRFIPIKITNILSKINKSMINEEDEDVFIDWQRKYDIIYGSLNGAKEYFCAANYYEAQKILETTEDFYKRECQ